MKSNRNEEGQTDSLPTIRLSEFNRFLKLPCRVLRRHVFYGLKEDKDTQTIECLSCGDVIEFHKDGRNRIEKSLWECYGAYKDTINLDPPPEKRPKKKWNPKYLFMRG